MKIKFFKPYNTEDEIKYIKDILNHGLVISGDGPYTEKVSKLLQKKYHVFKVLLTTSGTTSLEMAVRLLNLKPDDEVIIPSFTFSSTANAVLINNGKPVFAEIQPDTLNIDPEDIKKKITKKTKAIIVVHYAGVAADMDRIIKIARKNKLKVIEDAAQAIDGKYKNRFLGTIADFGCLSFHETKNIVCGEGGALFININDQKIIERAEIIREKGTNRTKFFRGEVDKYTWVSCGSSYLLSDILAAFLYAQLKAINKIQKLRFKIYNYYYKRLLVFEKKGIIRLPVIPSYASHNAHMFYILLNNLKDKSKVLTYLRNKGIQASFHYVPLHSSPMGIFLGNKKDELPITTEMSDCLLRLPLYAGMNKQEYQYVIDALVKILNNLLHSNV